MYLQANAAFRYLLLILSITIVSISCEKCKLINGISFHCDSIKKIPSVETIKEVIIKGDNSSETINKEDFKNCKTLYRLFVHKAINKIEPNAFKYLENLEELEIIENNMTEITREMFSNGLGKLLLLNLGSNQLKNVHSSMFKGLTSLETLILEHNTFNFIETLSVPSLQSLMLTSCQIYGLKENALSDIKKLKNLYLSDNLLSDFKALDLLNGSLNVEVLWLYKNLLTKLNGDMFRGLMKLKKLHLAWNNIEIVEPMTFDHTPSLEVLHLTNNRISKLQIDVLPNKGLNRLKHLYLGHNRLTYLKLNFLNRLPHLEGIFLGGNPWQCGCFDVIHQWIISNNVKYPCDKDYFKGMMSICVIGEKGPNYCSYNDDLYFYNMYTRQGQDQFRSKIWCLL